MKKLFGFLLIVLVVACEGPQGPKGEDGSSNSYVSPIYEIRANEWQLITMSDGVSKGYICEINDRNLLADDYNYAAVNCYLYLGMGTEYESKTPLPYVEIFRDGEGYTYTEHYTFEFSPGFITFYIKNNSPASLPPPGVCYFQVVVTY